MRIKLTKFFTLAFLFMSFIEYLHGQQRKLLNVEGIIVYWDKDTIPQDIIIIPATIDNNISFEENVINILDHYTGYGIYTYFQNIRWTQQGSLLQVMSSLNCIKGSINKIAYLLDTVVRISYGRIVFDQTFNDKLWVPRPPYSDNIILTIQQSNYPIIIRDDPREFGVPKQFERLDFFTIKPK